MFGEIKSQIETSQDDFGMIRDLVYGYSGLYFSDDSKYLLEKRLGRRLLEANFKSFREYYQFLKFNRNREEELEEIMNLLTTNETYFFREAYQLNAFSDEIIPEIAEKRSATPLGKRLRIWSAGCSTGEEPYTIAMLLLEKEMMKGWQIDIVATDISQRVLKHARQGIYVENSFRMTDKYYKLKYFTRQEDNRYRINDNVRKMVSISHLNLLDHPRLAMLGRFDIIFCRNVIIYFDQSAKKKVIGSFHSSLKDGGFLLLGHSESLMNITTDFNLRHFKNDMVYQKPLSALAGGAQ